MQQQQEMYANEYGDEMMMQQMGQPQYMEQSDATNALVRSPNSPTLATHVKSFCETTTRS